MLTLSVDVLDKLLHDNYKKVYILDYQQQQYFWMDPFTSDQNIHGSRMSLEIIKMIKRLCKKLSIDSKTSYSNPMQFCQVTGSDCC